MVNGSVRAKTHDLSWCQGRSTSAWHHRVSCGGYGGATRNASAAGTGSSLVEVEEVNVNLVLAKVDVEVHVDTLNEVEVLVFGIVLAEELVFPLLDSNALAKAKAASALSSCAIAACAG
eukprot:2072757-Amphidinium_carterae.2